MAAARCFWVKKEILCFGEFDFDCPHYNTDVIGHVPILGLHVNFIAKRLHEVLKAGIFS